ncbi:hypothetical protein [Pacificibacter marinus]|jgi:hypothetical protein|uniref:Uncharacterized protein n=1 Tax=Pacificibacter marinus TaxID=658057 RepID=A0A1Y5TPT7_9RHOB|nr:hypothetical protein [Pacificibacter marinus]SEL34962.1 hypothetical protein SAMN04488032_1195 [Pacificibacter marinus]SLN69111.1 hypothetical protein PAM7971_03689 [Pacificibacter marinus]
MLFEFIATLSLGAGAAGLVLLLQKFTRGALPRFAMPAAAGLAMFAFTIWSEYSWAARSMAALGPDAVVARAIEQKQVWRPWTYLAPVTTRLIALDGAKTKDFDGTVVTDMYLLSRWQDGAVVPVALDCLLNRRADLFAGHGEDIKVTLQSADWLAVGADDPVLRAACDTLRSD